MLPTPALLFVPAALLHCGLRNGRKAAWLTLALALTMHIPSFIGISRATAEGRLDIAVFTGLVLCIGIPALLALPLIQRAESFGRVLMSSMAAAVGGMALTEIGIRAIFAFSPYAELVAGANTMTRQAIEVYRKAGVPFDALQEVQRLMGYGIVVLPATFLIMIAMAFVLSLLLVGRLRVWRDLAARRPEGEHAFATYYFRNLSLPDWLLFAFIAGGLTPVLSGPLQAIAANLLTLVAFLYLLQGLAILRSVLATTGASSLSMLFGFLLLAILSFTWIPQLLLSITGLFDSFFDFRHFKRKDDSHESHTD